MKRFRLAILKVAIGSGFLFSGVGFATTVDTNAVDAAIYLNNKAYLFKDNQYFRYTLNNASPTFASKDKGYPKNLPGGWLGLSGRFTQQIDAALFYPPNGKSYLFSGSQYVRLTGVRVDNGYPVNLPGGWKGLPAHFHSDIDAAVYRGGHTYFFKGNEYVRFTNTTMDAGYPKKLPGGWRLGAQFKNRIDAALNYKQTNDIQLFWGAQHARLNDTVIRPDYPRYSRETWVGLNGSNDSVPEFIPWTTQDILRANIDEYAQYSLMRMFNGQASEQIFASSILSAVANKRLAGVYVVDQQPAAQRALTLGKNWWTLLPEGVSALCITSPDGQAPMIVFSKEVRQNKQALDQNLAVAWQSCDLENAPFPGYVQNLPPKQPRTESCSSEPGTGTIDISITNNGQPFEGALYQLHQGDTQVASGSVSGSRFSVGSLDSGLYSVSVGASNEIGFAMVDLPGSCRVAVSINMLNKAEKHSQGSCDYYQKNLALAKCVGTYANQIQQCNTTYTDTISGSCDEQCLQTATVSKQSCLGNSYRAQAMCNTSSVPEGC